MPPKKKAVTKKKEEEVLEVEPIKEESENVATCEEHVLLQLPIAPSALDDMIHMDDMNMILEYTPNIHDPTPYIPNDNFVILHDTVASLDEQPSMDVVQDAKVSAPTTTKETASRCKLCYWCCHEVGHMTFGMPIRYDSFNKTFTVYGTFCSLECAAAHNFSVHLGSDRAWEIHSWIQMIGKRYGYLDPIRPAPSRYLLRMFDGPLSIEEFRNAHKGQARTYMLNIPPLIAVNSQMEVMNTSYLTEPTEPVEKKTDKKKALPLKMNFTVYAKST